MRIVAAGRRGRPALLAAAFGLLASAVLADEAVIMPDGFVIRGEVYREKDWEVFGGVPLLLPKANGFDAVQDGPKNVIFSTHVQRGGKVEKDLLKSTLPAYTTKLSVVGKKQPFPADMTAKKVPEFDDRWVRKVEFRDPFNAFEIVTQKITALDPYKLTIDSPSHTFRQHYHTAEFPPAVVRKLLATHPDLKDPAGQVDPVRRMNIAAFLKDVGAADFDGAGLWFAAARAELDRLKKDAPGAWGKDPTERFEKLKAEIDAAESRRLLDELEAAVGAGRYAFAQKFLKQFTLKSTDPKDITRLSVLKAQVETVEPRFEQTARLLRDLVNREGGLGAAREAGALGGGMAVALARRPTPTPELATLVAAGEAILDELHPDTAARLELFRQQADQQRKSLSDPGGKADQLLALAVTGWLKGKNGATPDVGAALRCWATREMAVRYLREAIGNNRRALLDGYTGGKPVGPEDVALVAQIVSFLPPSDPEDLGKRTGTPVARTDAVAADGIYKRNTGPLPAVPAGRDYLLRLPAEYHHGRAYPVLIAIPAPNLPADVLVARLAAHCDREGYILAAPDWAGRFAAVQAYDFSGKDHPYVTATLRDLQRHFQVDPDKVFLFGYGEGANFALDVGMAHPDLFAGVSGFNFNPPKNIYREYWHNAQKLPAYFVTGDLAGTFQHVRTLYQNWMQKGFPALLTLYRGRGAEWYRMELPRLFDWMARKTRVRGTGSLRLDQKGVESWQVLRETDNRYYWIGVGEDGLRNPNIMEGYTPGKVISPASFRADILAGNVVKISDVRGVKKFVVWLDKDVIDWSKEVKVQLSDGPPRGYKPKVLQPDLHLMFEQVYQSGDRKMLFLGKLELGG